MPPEPSVSVVMTTYNGARWIGPQLASIVAQSRPPEELVVCDDGSTDATLAAVHDLTAGAPWPTRVLTNTTGRPLRVVDNLERGLRAAGGDVLVLADQDDEWLPHRLDRALEVMTAERADLVFADGLLIDGEGRPLPGRLWERAGFHTRLRRTWARDPFEALIRRNVVTGAVLAFRRDLLDLVLPIDTPWWHDGWIALLAAAMRRRLVALDEPLIRYRLHGANSAGVPPADRRDRLRHVTRHGLQPAVMAGHFAAAADRLAGRAAGTADPATVARLRAAAAFWAASPDPGGPRSGVAGVARRWIAGDYRSFGSGWRAALLDAAIVLAPRRSDAPADRRDPTERPGDQRRAAAGR
jgi:hypothetical protein